MTLGGGDLHMLITPGVVANEVAEIAVHHLGMEQIQLGKDVGTIDELNHLQRLILAGIEIMGFSGGI